MSFLHPRSGPSLCLDELVAAASTLLGRLALCVREGEEPSLRCPRCTSGARAYWESVPFSSSRMEALEERISDLEAMGLMGEMVVAEFLRQRVAPLQHHSAGMGALNSCRASLRLELAWLPPDAVAAAVGLLLGARQVPPLPSMATLLYDVPEAADTLGRMPHFDRWRACPRGTMRDNPCTFRMFGDEVSELEDEGVNLLQAVVNPLAGRTTLVFLSGSSSEEGQGVNPAVIRAPDNPLQT